MGKSILRVVKKGYMFLSIIGGNLVSKGRTLLHNAALVK